MNTNQDNGSESESNAEAYEDLIPSREEIEASAGVYSGRHESQNTPGLFGAPGATREFQAMLWELKGRIYDYEAAKAKASASDRAAIEHGIAIMKQHQEDLQAAFRIGAESVTAIARIRYCPDCLPHVRTPLALNRRYCDQHRDQRRKITNRLAKRKEREHQMSAVSAVITEAKQRDIMKNATEAPGPVEMVKRKLIGLAHGEKLSLYTAAEKLGIVKQQVNLWLYRDDDFRLMARAARATYFVELLSEAVELLKVTRPLTEREKCVIQIAAIMAANPDAANFLVSAEEPKPRQLSVREMQAVDRELEKARESNRPALLEF